MNFIDKIYVVHYAPLKDRKEFMLKQFELFGIINYEIVEGIGRNSIDEDFINNFNKEHNTNLTAAVVAISITHVDIYRDIVKNNYKSCLILEDDAILCADFDIHFNNYMNTIPNDYDMAFINGGYRHVEHTTPDKIWYKEHTTNTCCAYIVTKKACEIIIPSILPFMGGIDQDLNPIIINHKLNVYWCEPTIVSDGSQKYGSSHEPESLGKYLGMYLRYEL